MPRNPHDAKGAADRVLDDFVGIAEGLHIRYFLGLGTCLGMVRDGGYIEGDHDIDVCVICSGEERQKLARALVAHGFRPSTVHPSSHWFYKNDILLDVWRRFSDSDKPFCHSFQKIVYNGKEYNVPHPVEDYLKLHYKNWRVRVKR